MYRLLQAPGNGPLDSCTDVAPQRKYHFGYWRNYLDLKVRNETLSPAPPSGRCIVCDEIFFFFSNLMRKGEDWGSGRLS
jgi:hypothetical protein